MKGSFLGSLLVQLTGALLVIVAINMCEARKEVLVPGSAGRNAKIGAAAGAGIGAATGAAIGGVGIALCGTGIGIPAGLVVLGLGALGAGGGYMAGGLTDTQDTTVMKEAYPAWHWVSVMLVGAAMLAIGCIRLWSRTHPHAVDRDVG